MYLLDASAVITPFHRSKLEALSLALRKDPNTAQRYLTQWFSSGFTQGKLLLCAEAKDEVSRGGGHASSLLRSVGGTSHIVHHDSGSLELLPHVHEFVMEHFEDQHARAFLGPKVADPHLVAIAKACGYCIVTEESHAMRDAESGRMTGPVKLPYVAFAFGVRCMPLMAALSHHPNW